MLNNIRQVIQKKGLKTIFVIEKSGLSTSSFYEIMNGKAVPSLMNARKIAVALECTVNDIFPEVLKEDTNEESK